MFPDKIVDIILEHFGVTITQVRSRNKDLNLVECRKVIVQYLNKHTYLTPGDIRDRINKTRFAYMKYLRIPIETDTRKIDFQIENYLEHNPHYDLSKINLEQVPSEHGFLTKKEAEESKERINKMMGLPKREGFHIMGVYEKGDLWYLSR